MTILKRRFAKFEEYIRLNYKDVTTSNRLFNEVLSTDREIFLVYFLKILLEHMSKLKNTSSPKVNPSDKEKAKIGCRSSIPYPKGGVAKIKNGKLPILDLKEMVNSLLPNAIQEFYKCLRNDNKLRSTLEKLNSKPGELSLEELRSSIKVVARNERIFVSPVPFSRFDIREYLKESDAKFIYPEIRKNIEIVHNDIVQPLWEAYSNELFINMGILPIDAAPPEIPLKYLKLFYTGKAVSLGFYSTESLTNVINSIFFLDIIPVKCLIFVDYDRLTLIITELSYIYPLASNAINLIETKESSPKTIYTLEDTYNTNESIYNTNHTHEILEETHHIGDSIRSRNI